MTEQDIQRALYDYRRLIAGFPIMVPNTYLWSWESDLLYLSKSLYVTEYEIKTTRADFLKDKLKEHKHWRLSTDESPGPKYFYYVCPAGLILPYEPPEYAGLMYVHSRKKKYGMAAHKIEVIRKAKVRKVEPLDNRKLLSLLTKGVSRYWTLLGKVENNARNTD